MKHILIILTIFYFSPISTIAQEIKIKTSYTKLEEGSVGPEEFEFNFSDGWLLKKDLYNGYYDSYPAIIDDSFYDESGFYCITFSPVSYIKSNPLEWSNNYNGDMRLYKIVYNERGGQVLYILEIKGRNKSNSRSKYYLTELGKKTFKNY